jgi:hypothetical protein
MRRSLGGGEDQGRAASRRKRQQTACPLRARSAGQHRELTVTPGQPGTPAHLRTGRLTRCANRPSGQRVRYGPTSSNIFAALLHSVALTSRASRYDRRLNPDQRCSHLGEFREKRAWHAGLAAHFYS